MIKTVASEGKRTVRHTKGAWKIGSLALTSEGFPTKHSHYEIVSDNSMTWIAHVLCFSDSNNGSEYEANVRLIAAAPNLFKALQLAFENDGPMYSWVNEKGIGATEYKRRSEVVELGRAALAEAKGEL